MSKIRHDHIFRKYLQDDLRFVDYPFFLQASVRFVLDLAIWIAPESYQKFPIYEPLAYRDQKATGPPDLRGKANIDTALLIDDNSMIKNYAKSKVVFSKNISYYEGKKMDEGFWACHIWDRLDDGSLTNLDNRLFSFVPNIVWLPKELSRLTDHVPIIKDVMKQLSLHLYRELNLKNPDLQRIVDESWSKLEKSGYNKIIPLSALPDISDYNTMLIPDSTINRKVKKNKKFATGLLEHGMGHPVPLDSQVHKFGKSISTITNLAAATEIGTFLEAYLNALP